MLESSIATERRAWLEATVGSKELQVSSSADVHGMFDRSTHEL